MSANPRRELSVVEPIGIAFDRMRRILFEPFDAGKWFALGFCAFLAQLGESGGSSARLANRLPGAISNSGVDPFDWAKAHLPMVLIVGAVVVLFALAFGLLIMWLSSRGKFMFLDGVVQNRGAVVEPWKRWAEAGWSLFLFRVAISVVALLVMAAFVGLIAVIAVPMIRAGNEDRLLPLILAMVAVAFVVFLPFMVVHFLLNQFFVPIMYVRGGGVGDAWAEFKVRLLPEIGPVILFALMLFLLTIGAVLIAFVATCLTCCLAALPYLGTVILLPIPVFFRCYSLEFLAQLGGDYERLRGGVDVGGTFD